MQCVMKDPLMMSNGIDMLEMVCNSYESPDEEAGGEDEENDDEAEQFDFSEHTPLWWQGVCLCHLHALARTARQQEQEVDVIYRFS